MFVSKRDIVKFATQIAVTSAAIKASTTVIETVVDPQDNTASQRVDTGGFVAGTLIGMSLSRHTDRMVDRVADWRIARKEQKDAVTE